jgi:hypothetical protein
MASAVIEIRRRRDRDAWGIAAGQHGTILAVRPPIVKVPAGVGNGIYGAAFCRCAYVSTRMNRVDERSKPE